MDTQWIQGEYRMNTEWKHNENIMDKIYKQWNQNKYIMNTKCIQNANRKKT